MPYRPFMDPISQAMYLPGIAGQLARSLDSVANSVLGDLDARIELQPVGTWFNTVTTRGVMGKSIANNRAWSSAITSAASHILQGTCSFTLTTTDVTADSTVAPSAVFAANERGALRVTRDAATGIWRYYTAPRIDQAWVQLGADVAGTAGALVDNTQFLAIGSYNQNVASLEARFYRFQLFNGINVNKVFDIDFAGWPLGTKVITESVNGAIVTLDAQATLVAD